MVASMGEKQKKGREGMNRQTNLHDYLYDENRQQSCGGMGEKAEWFFFGMVAGVTIIAMGILCMMFNTSV